MFKEQCCNRQNDISANFSNFNDVNMEVDINVDNTPMQMPNANMGMMGQTTSPIIEPVQERVVQRTIMHEVPHVC